MTDAGAPRTVILLRHGTAESPPGVPDRDRPLAARGRQQAELAGGWIERHQPPVEQILCSTALRTRQTAAHLGIAAPVSHQARIYEAEPEVLLDLLRDLDEQRTVLLVGHAPGLPQLAGQLAGSGSDEGALDRLRAGFPAAALAVLHLRGEWWSLGPGSCTLLDVVHPDAAPTR